MRLCQHTLADSASNTRLEGHPTSVINHLSEWCTMPLRGCDAQYILERNSPIFAPRERFSQNKRIHQRRNRFLHRPGTSLTFVVLNLVLATFNHRWHTEQAPFDWAEDIHSAVPRFKIVQFIHRQSFRIRREDKKKRYKSILPATNSLSRRPVRANDQLFERLARSFQLRVSLRLPKY